MTSLINTVVLIVVINQVNAPWWLYVMLGAAVATDFVSAVYKSGEKNNGKNV